MLEMDERLYVYSCEVYPMCSWNMCNVSRLIKSIEEIWTSRAEIEVTKALIFTSIYIILSDGSHLICTQDFYIEKAWAELKL